jgi:hypothetical protein
MENEKKYKKKSRSNTKSTVLQKKKVKRGEG